MIITCRNKGQKNGKKYNLYRSDLDNGCEECYFLATHMGQHWTDDWAKCMCPVKVSYKDKIKIVEKTVKKIN